MDEPVLRVLVQDGRVLSPAVGLWGSHPVAGALLSPGAFVGSLVQGNRRRILALPVGSSGRLVTSLPRDRLVPVAYGTLLFELAPLTADELQPAEAADRSRHPGGLDLPAGTRAVIAPTDGVFYRRAAPGSPAFVEPGQTVHAGQAIGLVEVMKTFNQVLYGGPDLPDRATVVEIRTGDGEEIRAGQVLLLVREA
jgi:acetyl-CoA carboxylase biotin carboxyl carrier protein